MDIGEFCLWWAEYRRNPWGELREDINNGIAVRQLLSPHVKKEGDLPPMENFILFQDKEKNAKPVDPDELLLQQFRELR